MSEQDRFKREGERLKKRGWRSELKEYERDVLVARGWIPNGEDWWMPTDHQGGKVLVNCCAAVKWVERHITIRNIVGKDPKQI